MNKSDLLIPSWVDHEMQNWARWSLSAEYPGCPDWPGPRMARDLISRFYRAPDWGDDVRPLPPNEAHAQEIIDLMGAYPGRAFRMREIVKYVAGKTLSSEERHRVRMQLAHVMRELETMGCIFRRPSASKRGGYALYRWRS